MIICKNTSVVKKRFGLDEESLGICYTRTGRRFFNEKTEEQAFLQLLHDELSAKDAWTELATDWICLDAELMPWSAKAQSLIRQQYASVGAAATAATQSAVTTLRASIGNGNAIVSELLQQFEQRQDDADLFVKSYRQYCWPVNSIGDYKLAPFHILATEGGTYFHKEHVWHMNTIARWCGNGLLLATPYRVVNLTDEQEVIKAINWWEAMVAEGREGMVVKPVSFIAKTAKAQLIQPAIKVRGPEYLRIIYGPSYNEPANLKRLKKRGLQAKRSLALREFSLGVAALECFVKKEPLRITHQKVFAILALESEPVDPRL